MVGGLWPQSIAYYGARPLRATLPVPYVGASATPQLSATAAAGMNVLAQLFALEPVKVGAGGGGCGRGERGGNEGNGEGRAVEWVGMGRKN